MPKTAAETGGSDYNYYFASSPLIISSRWHALNFYHGKPVEVVSNVYFKKVVSLSVLTEY